MKQWELYQHQAAALLRELGFTADVNVGIEEPNGTLHAIDVAARRTIAGVNLLWIVECKLWNKPVDIGPVRQLRGLLVDLGADHGLLMSESGFQSGAVMSAKQKNITLTSLADLRANAADEILASRVAHAERRLMDLYLRVNRDLRGFAMRTEHMLASFAARLPPETVEGFAARPEAIEYVHGIHEVQVAAGTTAEDSLRFMTHPDESRRAWRVGVEEDVMEGVFLNIYYTTQALYQGRLGQWPAMCTSVNRDIRLAWSMPQLIDVIEPKLPVLEQTVSEQEASADQTPRLPWFGMIEPGTLPPQRHPAQGSSGTRRRLPHPPAPSK